jgi:hypothetical protein
LQCARTSHRRQYAGSPSRGNTGGHERDGKHQAGSRRDREGIGAGDPEEQACDEAAERERAANAERNADHHRYHGFANHHSDDIAAAGTEGNSDANLPSALGDGISHHAVQAERGEAECERSKDAGEECHHALARSRRRKVSST